ncbi:hypothetical protein TCON_1402 [Astathelohania contejeani]|uniref:Uncharacterized protein n=1 Tax=Astathelohania contejeani TaxID=164912 RepID=A0ABQ7HZ15_9MICR|nr:hypothetical protein TCON_1402 [Thelohania contejeani]
MTTSENYSLVGGIYINSDILVTNLDTTDNNEDVNKVIEMLKKKQIKIKSKSVVELKEKTLIIVLKFNSTAKNKNTISKVNWDDTQIKISNNEMTVPKTNIIPHEDLIILFYDKKSDFRIILNNEYAITIKMNEKRNRNTKKTFYINGNIQFIQVKNRNNKQYSIVLVSANSFIRENMDNQHDSKIKKLDQNSHDNTLSTDASMGPTTNQPTLNSATKREDTHSNPSNFHEEVKSPNTSTSSNITAKSTEDNNGLANNNTSPTDSVKPSEIKKDSDETISSGNYYYYIIAFAVVFCLALLGFMFLKKYIK